VDPPTRVRISAPALFIFIKIVVPSGFAFIIRSFTGPSCPDYGIFSLTGILALACQSGKSLVLVWEDNGCGVVDKNKDQVMDRGFGKNTGRPVRSL
jgi:hypothetical protein